MTSPVFFSEKVFFSIDPPQKSHDLPWFNNDLSWFNHYSSIFTLFTMIYPVMFPMSQGTRTPGYALDAAHGHATGGGERNSFFFEFWVIQSWTSGHVWWFLWVFRIFSFHFRESSWISDKPVEKTSSGQIINHQKDRQWWTILHLAMMWKYEENINIWYVQQKQIIYS